MTKYDRRIIRAMFAFIVRLMFHIYCWQLGLKTSMSREQFEDEYHDLCNNVDRWTDQED
jgi:hypothetical protein